jgi:hypothetical protein
MGMEAVAVVLRRMTLVKKRTKIAVYNQRTWKMLMLQKIGRGRPSVKRLKLKGVAASQKNNKNIHLHLRRTIRRMRVAENVAATQHNMSKCGGE